MSFNKIYTPHYKTYKSLENTSFSRLLTIYTEGSSFQPIVENCFDGFMGLSILN
jgi:hypothetical protein